MAGEMLLINPRRRRKARKTRRVRARRRNPVTVITRSSPVRRRRANPVARRRRVIRRSNPGQSIFARKRNPSRRRRNPVSLGGTSTYINAIKDAMIGAGGAVAIDVLFGWLAPKLPASMQKVAGKVGVYEGIKALATVALGQILNRPTRGLSRKLAMGSLTVQAAEVMKTFVPASMTLGYASPAFILPASARVGPNRLNGGVGRYMAPGSTALLSQYMPPGQTALLNGRSMREREGHMR